MMPNEIKNIHNFMNKRRSHPQKFAYAQADKIK